MTFVLEQILKSELKNASYYERLLEETDRAIGVKKTSKYVCCLVRPSRKLFKVRTS